MMPPKYWASSEDMSIDSSESVDSSIDLNVDRVNKAARAATNADEGRENSIGSLGDSEDNALARTMATNLSIPNLQPQQHANLFYLSLIEDRCRTQAAKSLNAQRRKENWLDDGHPEVCELAQHMFTEMKRDLLKAGIISQELASKSPDLQVYLRSFDALLHNIATTRGNQNISIGYRSSLPVGTDNSRALVKQSGKNDAIILDPTVLSLVNLNSAKAYPQSVYCQQYEEISMLGSGGEGAVYKAKYMVDRAEYAIKKVVISAKKLRQLQRTSSSLAEKLKEVYALAKLNHPNVVRYHHSWIEFQRAGDHVVASEEQDSSSSSGDEAIASEVNCRTKSRDEIEIASEEHGGTSKHIGANNGASESVDISDSRSAAQASYSEADTSLAEEVENLHLGFTQHDLTASLNQFTVQDESYDNNLVVFGHSSDIVPDFEESKTQSKAVERYRRPGKANIDAVLYIKMTAYPSTLDTFLHNGHDNPQIIPRHCFHILPTIRILRTIIDGLQYIHRKNIIHQDLKPGNIFLSILEAGEPSTPAYVNIIDCPDCEMHESIRPLYVCPHIGDFGMIKEIKSGQLTRENLKLDKAHTSHESEIISSRFSDMNVSAYKAGDSFLAGTGFYKPPWIRGIKPIICPKRDCYALGVIALEMIHRFGSKSERVHVFNQLRDHGIFPREVKDHKLSECILGMLQVDREQRWTLERVKAFLVDMEERLC